MEKHYSDEPIDYLLEFLGRDDRYPSDHFVLYADELSCAVHSETLYKALCSLPEKQRKVLLLSLIHISLGCSVREEIENTNYPEQAYELGKSLK